MVSLQKRMKKFFVTAMILGGAVFGTSALAVDLTPETGPKVVTIKGRATCLNHGLKEDDYCKTVLIAEKNGVPTKYYVVQNEVGKKFHPEICADAKPTKITGLLRKVLDRWELTPQRITLE